MSATIAPDPRLEAGLEPTELKATT